MQNVLQGCTRRRSFDIEYALAYIIQDFKTKLLMRQEKDNNKNPIYLTKKLDLFQNCLHGIAAIICNLCAVKYEGNRCTEGYFKDYLPNSLKAITKCTNFRHQVIRWFWLKIKPNHMPFKDFFNEWVQILTYVKKEYLHRWMDLPIEAKLCK